ncbi:MAG: Spermidine/putrescine import ATP-binding protein PotA [Arenicellales bacterium IbO2]|nr:ABC transporter ATP-binding protein [Gammaproteobacteria bacterium]MDA8008577.1 ABC transporter ATP-binding protein [Alphaproteobacteria bacterium]MDA8030227.1 ABC transporter ATP-binding protein [Alphaproteobacteria bacterium]CAJ2376388.1 MAG: Spermidine/putrescine import ATP-binding protein PotA [Arenicellales bacterium IbO2]
MTHDLECVALSKRFGDFTAVDNVSLQIPRGSFFSILGPSGCGKTTLLRMVAGFETPSEGDILIKGGSVLAVPPNRRNVKMVFQHLALFPMMNVAENIAYGLRCNGVARKHEKELISDVLERVGLPGAAKKEIHQLSGGQKQRVAIARCMVLKPEALLLDEPLGALDLKLRERMKVELKMLQRQFDTTFIYITHDQSEALVMSDQVAVMNGGRFEQVGSPRELYHQPQTAFVAGFVGDSNRWKGKITAVDGADIQVETGKNFRLFGKSGTGALSVGMQAEVFVRPEAVSIVPAESGAPPDNANLQCGRIDDILFNGANSRALVRTDDGDVVEAALPPAGEFADLRPDMRVGLRWPAADCKCFAAPASE